MENRKNVSQEEWAMEGLANMLTRGHLDFVRNFFYLLVRVTAAQSTVFFRSCFGTKAISFGTMVWGWLLFSVLWSFETLGRVDFRMKFGTEMDGNPSFLLLVIHLILFVGFALYRMVESTRNLQNYIEERHSESTGISLLWPAAYRILARFNLVTDADGYTAWYQMNEFKFQKWIEPAGVILFGLLMKDLEFTVYGNFLILSGISILMTASVQEMNFYSFRQSQWDAQIAAGLIDNPEEQVTRRSGMVAARSLIAKENAEYERWRESHENQINHGTAAASPA